MTRKGKDKQKKLIRKAHKHIKASTIQELELTNEALAAMQGGWMKPSQMTSSLKHDK